MTAGTLTRLFFDAVERYGAGVGLCAARTATCWKVPIAARKS